MGKVSNKKMYLTANIVGLLKEHYRIGKKNNCEDHLFK